MNEYLIKALKDGRTKKGLKQSEVAALLGVKGGTLSNYENGISEPDIDTFATLCEIYNLDFSYILSEAYGLGVQGNSFKIKPSEIDHIEKYRSLDAYGQETVSYILDRESERVASLQKQADHIKQLESRPAAMIGIGADGSEDRMRFFSYYQRMASAGSGEFLFQDIPTDVIAVPDTQLSRRADFVIGVNGQSMEPTYFDGDKVLVEKTNSISIGEIGIFIVGTECFIKEAGKDRLISHNEDKEKYPDIIPDERRIDTVGRVLGKIGE